MSSRHRSIEQLHRREPRWRSGLALIVFLLLAFALLVLANPARADDAEALPTESPYFFIPGADTGLDRLPLKATRVDARHRSAPIADVTVTQHYRNEGQRPIEARYVFPGSTAAAGARDDGAHRRPRCSPPTSGEAGRAHRVRGGENGRQDRARCSSSSGRTCSR